MGAETILRVEDLAKSFPSGGPALPWQRRGRVQALRGVSFGVRRGETYGLIGESGSGKTTLGRLVIGLLRPDDGRIIFEGRDVVEPRGRALRELRRRMHFIFQDPYDALRPGMRVRDIVAEPLVIHRVGDGAERRERALQALEQVDLQPAASFAERYPHQLSGGQRQRVALARAFVLRPELVIADEPTSMLDVSIRAGLVRKMVDLRERTGTTFLFITHDLALARHFCERILVLFRGKAVEEGPVGALVERPLHPYTGALIAAVEQLAAPAGDPAGVTAFDTSAGASTGCPYRRQCPMAMAICESVDPPLVEVERGRRVACHAWPPGADAHGETPSRRKETHDDDEAQTHLLHPRRSGG